MFIRIAAKKGLTQFGEKTISRRSRKFPQIEMDQRLRKSAGTGNRLRGA